MARSPKWEVKMNEVIALRQQGAGNLFKRVVLMIEINADPRFIEWCEANETNREEYLNAGLSDTAMDFATLCMLYDEYPDEQSWVDMNIRQLVAQIILKRRQERAKDNPRRPSAKDKLIIAEAEIQKIRTEHAVEIERLVGEKNALAARVKELQGVIRIMSGKGDVDAEAA